MKKAAVVFLFFIFLGNITVTHAEEVAIPAQLGVDLDGKPFNLKDHLGKENLYIVFWTTWCGVCRDQIPTFKEIVKQKGVQFIAINPGINDSLQRTKRYKEKYDLQYTIIFDGSTLSAQTFGIYGVPTAILISKNKEILYQGFPPPAESLDEIFASS